MAFLAIGFLFLLATASPAMNDAPGEQVDDIIKLNVGGQLFETRRSTLCSYPDTPLGCMFDKDLGMQPSQMTDQGYFLDENPRLFQFMLDFLRHQTVPTLPKEDSALLRKMAEKWLPPMVPIIRKPRIKREEKLVAMQGTDQRGEMGWFLYDDRRKRIVGNSKWVYHDKQHVDSVIREHKNRSCQKDLTYAWSGHGSAIYNLKTGAMIGEPVMKWRKHPVEFQKTFFPLHLIEATISAGKKRYLCSFNKKGSFSAFNAKTGKKVLLDREFSTLERCLIALQGFNT